MQAAASWAATATSSNQHAHRRITRSSFRLVSWSSAAAHAHLTQPADGTHRAKALTKLQLAANLEQPPFASTPAECLNRTQW